MKKKALATLGATASVLAGTVALAPPALAAYSCSWNVVAAQVTPHPLNLEYDFIDVAVAEATCTDLALVAHNASFEFEWYYESSSGTAPMPACPTTVVSPNIPWIGAGVIPGVATCHRPPSSDAFEVPRSVCVTFILDGFAVGGQACREVLLNPTPI